MSGSSHPSSLLHTTRFTLVGIIPVQAIYHMMDDRSGAAPNDPVDRGEPSGSTVEYRLGPVWGSCGEPLDRANPGRCAPILIHAGGNTCIAEIDEEDAQYGEVGLKADEVIEPLCKAPVSLHLADPVRAEPSMKTEEQGRFLDWEESTFAVPQIRAAEHSVSDVADSDIWMASRSIVRAWPLPRPAPTAHGHNLEFDGGMTGCVTELVNGFEDWLVNKATNDVSSPGGPLHQVADYANGLCSSVSMTSRS